MPLKKWVEKTKVFDCFRRETLLVGPENELLAGLGYTGGTNWDEVPVAKRRNLLAVMEADWRAHRAVLLQSWTAEEQPWWAAPSGPGTRPLAWWAFDVPEPLLEEGETQLHNLSRLRLLTPLERTL